MEILKIKLWLERRKRQEQLEKDVLKVYPKAGEIVNLLYKEDYSRTQHLEKRVFKIDVGDIDDIDIETYVKKIERQLKKNS